MCQRASTVTGTMGAILETVSSTDKNIINYLAMENRVATIIP